MDQILVTFLFVVRFQKFKVLQKADDVENTAIKFLDSGEKARLGMLPETKYFFWPDLLQA